MRATSTTGSSDAGEAVAAGDADGGSVGEPRVNTTPATKASTTRIGTRTGSHERRCGAPSPDVRRIAGASVMGVLRAGAYPSWGVRHSELDALPPALEERGVPTDLERAGGNASPEEQ